MKISMMTTLTLMAGCAAHGELMSTAAERKVTVCVPPGSPQMSPGAMAFAQMRASQIFEEVGVEIRWVNSVRHCPAEGILLDISYRTPATLQPHAMAYALPFDKTRRITVFYDRIVSDQTKAQIGPVLAYVMVHEITHILQGVSRHSATGIMKARWERKDFAAMTCETLHFEEEDRTWIERGFMWRASRNLIAANVLAGRE